MVFSAKKPSIHKISYKLSLYRGEISMSRIPPDDKAPIHIDAFSGITTMETLFRTMAHRPELAEHAMRLTEAAMRSGTVEPKLKEMVAIRVSQVNHCFY
jgi:alkylhydroperoxidase family enzyme